MKKQTKAILLYLPEELYQEIRKLAEEEERSVSNMLRRVIALGVKDKK